MSLDWQIYERRGLFLLGAGGVAAFSSKTPSVGTFTVCPCIPNHCPHREAAEVPLIPASQQFCKHQGRFAAAFERLWRAIPWTRLTWRCANRRTL